MKIITIGDSLWSINALFSSFSFSFSISASFNFTVAIKHAQSNTYCPTRTIRHALSNTQNYTTVLTFAKPYATVLTCKLKYYPAHANQYALSNMHTQTCTNKHVHSNTQTLKRCILITSLTTQHTLIFLNPLKLLSADGNDPRARGSLVNFSQR